MPARSTSPSHWTPQPSSRAQSNQRAYSLPPYAYVGGDFTFGLGNPDIVGAGLGEGKLSSPLGEDGVILSLPPTL